MTRRVPRARTVVALTAALLGAVGCGDPNSAAPDPTAAEDTGRGVSSPFTVGVVPDGMVPVIAGMGNGRPDWGEESTGTDVPFTVLAPEGSTDPAERIVVSITGFRGYEYGLDETLYRYGESTAPSITVAGLEARHLPPTPDRPGVLVVVAGDDLAVQIAAPDATLEELTGLFAHVDVPEDRTAAPTVSDPPAGLEVLGSVQVDAVLASRFNIVANTDRIDALPGTHVAAWARGGDGGVPNPRAVDLAVMTLPGTAADRDVLTELERWSHHPEWALEPLEVAGDPAVAITASTPNGIAPWAHRSVWRWTTGGDIVVVTSNGFDEEPLTTTELTAVAASVEPAGEDSWEEFVIEMTGGPGLHPDIGRAEIARGTRDGLEWLLQTAPQGNGESAGEGIDPTVIDAVDPCLKLSNLQRACVSASGGIPHDWVGTGGGGLSQADWDDLVIVSTTEHAARVRVTTPAGSAEADLHQVPGGSARAGVVFVDEPGFAWCGDPATTPEPPPGLTLMRVDFLDAAGTPVGCFGMGSLLGG